MTATDELRRMLDELRKLACDINEKEIRSHSVITLNQGRYNRQFRLDMNHDWLNAWHAEFERILQAIAATLGRGECKVDVLNTGDCAGYECSEYIMHCNACGHEFGHVLYNEDGDVWMSEKPNFCPNCGREVVDE